MGGREEGESKGRGWGAGVSPRRAPQVLVSICNLGAGLQQVQHGNPCGAPVKLSGLWFLPRMDGMRRLLFKFNFEFK